MTSLCETIKNNNAAIRASTEAFQRMTCTRALSLSPVKNSSAGAQRTQQMPLSPSLITPASIPLAAPAPLAAVPPREFPGSEASWDGGRAIMEAEIVEQNDRAHRSTSAPPLGLGN